MCLPCLNCSPARLPEWNRFYHDVVVAADRIWRPRTIADVQLLELLEILDPLVLPQAIDEIGHERRSYGCAAPRRHG